MLLFSSQKSNAQSFSDEKLFIGESSPKISGQFIFVFVDIADTVPVSTFFRFFFKENKILSCRMSLETYKIKYAKQADGNIFAECINKGIYYSSENYKIKKKVYPNEKYNLLAPNFLDMSNEERYKLLESLSKK